MKRRNFMLTSAVSAGILPLSANPQDKQKGFKTAAGEGRRHGHIQMKGLNENILDVKVSGKDTNGALAIFEQTSLSVNKGTPLHVHHHQDEIFQVLDGEYLFQVGEEKHILRTGDSIFLPRKVPHAWTQVTQPGKMTVILQPAGKLEEFFLTVASLKHIPDQKEIAKIFEDHEMIIVGPALKVG